MHSKCTPCLSTTPPAELTNKSVGNTSGSVDLVIDLPLVGFNVADLTTKLLSTHRDKLVDVLGLVVVVRR